MPRRTKDRNWKSPRFRNMPRRFESCCPALPAISFSFEDRPRGFTSLKTFCKVSIDVPQDLIFIKIIPWCTFGSAFTNFIRDHLELSFWGKGDGPTGHCYCSPVRAVRSSRCWHRVPRSIPDNKGFEKEDERENNTLDNRGVCGLVHHLDDLGEGRKRGSCSSNLWAWTVWRRRF